MVEALFNMNRVWILEYLTFQLRLPSRWDMLSLGFIKFNMNAFFIHLIFVFSFQAYLSLPEGTASVVGLIAMMTDHYSVIVSHLSFFFFFVNEWVIYLINTLKFMLNDFLRLLKKKKKKDFLLENSNGKLKRKLKLWNFCFIFICKQGRDVADCLFSKVVWSSCYMLMVMFVGGERKWRRRRRPWCFWSIG